MNHMDRLIEAASVTGQVIMKLLGIWWPAVIVLVVGAVIVDRQDKKDEEARKGRRTK